MNEETSIHKLPLDNIKSIKFSDLFDLEEVQKIQDAFSNATNVASIITYPDGIPITKPSNFCRLCSLVRSTKKGLINCTVSDAKIGEVKGKGPTIQPCLSAGLWDAGASIVLDGVHVANWLIGQVRNVELNDDEILAYAEEIGVSQKEFKKAYEEVPKMSKQQFEHVAEALYILANSISLKSYRNLQKERLIEKQKETEAVLLKNQKMLYDSQKAGNIGSWEYFIESDELVWTEQVYTIYGVDKSVKPDYKLFIDLVHPSERDGIKQKYLDTLKENKCFELDYHIIRPDKSIGYVKIYGNVERDENNKPYHTYGIVQDIAEQEKAEESLRLTQFSIDNSSDSHIWFNDEGRIVYANEAACKSLGYTRKELMNMRSFDFDPDFKIENWEQHKEEMRLKKRMVFESRHQRKDGSIFPVEVTTNYINFKGKFFACSFDKDITERKKFEEDLLKNQKLLNESQRIAKMGSWEQTLNDGSIYWSDSTYKLYGVDKEKTVLNKDLFMELVHPEDRDFVKKRLKELIKLGNVSNDEYRIIKPDGKTRNLVTSAEVLYDEKNSPIKLIGVVQDVTESKIAKEALVESEERARLFVENTPLPVALFDTSMCYIIASKQWYITYKVNDVDLTGRYHYDIFPETTDEWKELHQRAINGEVIKCDKDKFVREDGSIQWVRYELHPWYKGNKTIGGMVAFTEDITERVKAAEILKETEQIMQSLFTVAPIGLGFLKDRKVVDINPEVCRMSGYSREDFIGKDVKFLYPSEEEYERVGRILYGDLREKKYSKLETVWKRKDGEIINIYQAITLIDPDDPSKGIASTSVDITDRKKSEEVILKNQKLLLESQRIAKMGSWELDIKNSKLTWNKEAFNIFDYEYLSVEPTLEIFFNMMHPDDREKAEHYLEITIKDKKFYDFEGRIVTEKGNIKSIVIAGEVLLNEYEEVCRIYGIVQDITDSYLIKTELEQHKNNLESLIKEKTQALEQTNQELNEKNQLVKSQNKDLKTTLKNLKDTQKQLMHAEKLASIGVLTAGIAHEINNPLNYITGAYTALEKYINKNENYDKDKFLSMLNIIKTGVERTSRIVKGLNEFSRENSNFNEVCDIHSIIENSLVILTNIMKERIVIDKDYSADDIVIKGNSGKLHQVFMNIFTNSSHSIKDKGIISIHTEISSQKAVIKISDNGCGIKKEYLAKISDPFFTTKEPGQGTGLGLFITYSIIESHNGSIQFESEVEKGTTVTITLPVG